MKATEQHRGFTLIELPFGRLRAVRQWERSAFTLIELLVIVAIIAVLIMILAPSLRKAKQLARVAVCASNQRQMGTALHVYATTYLEYPTNEPPEYSHWYYRYRTRGGNGILWIYQMDGADGWRNEAYRCPESLPADNDLLGTVPIDGVSWTWAARHRRQHALEFDDGVVPNGQRSWFCYQGPLREYPVGILFEDQACTWYDVYANAWDLWGDAWRSNNSISPEAPIYRKGPLNSPNFYKKGEGPRVMGYCPAIVRMHGGSPYTWWYEWRAPHMDKPWDVDQVHVTADTDSRNYLFNDGHVRFLSY